MKHGLLFVDIRDRHIYLLAYPDGSRRRIPPATIKLRRTGDLMENGLDQALTHAAREFSWDHARCHISLPGAWIAYRNMEVPFREHRKVKQILPFEMEPLLPGGIEDYHYTFYSIEWDGAHRTHHIIGAAGRREVIDPVLAVVRCHDLEVTGLHASGMALALCLAEEAVETPSRALMLLDHRQLELYGMTNGILRMVRTCGRHPEQDPTSSGPVRYAQHFAAAFNSAAPEEGMPAWGLFDRAASSTGDALRDGMQAAMRHTRLQCLNTEVWQNVLPDTTTETPERYRGFEGAFAMATAKIRRLPQINFLEEKYNTVRSLQAYRPQLLRVGLLASAALAVFITHLIIGNHVLARHIDRLQQQQVAILQTAFPDIRRIVDPLHQMRSRVDQVSRQARPLTAFLETRPKLELLLGIVQSSPPGIHLEVNRMVLGEDRVVIQGAADNFDDVNQLKDNLDQWEAVRAATISSANLEQDQKRVRFQLSIETRSMRSPTPKRGAADAAASTPSVQNRELPQTP